MENKKELKEPIELFGYECGDGWLPLINEAQQFIDEWNGDHPDNEHGKCEFVQVKEKWGELCFYLNFYPIEIIDKIRDLEHQSLNICEFCGSNKNVKTKKTHGWYMTLCDECREKEESKWKERMKSYEPITTTKFEVNFEDSLKNIIET